MIARSRVPQIEGWDEMNRLERDWAVVLKLNAEVRRAVWQGARLRLAKSTLYTPDFMVFMASGLIEMHETKGYMREAARVRLNTAARLYPEFQFWKITRPKVLWRRELIPGAGAPEPDSADTPGRAS